jgi:hypothetical protein
MFRIYISIKQEGKNKKISSSKGKIDKKEKISRKTRTRKL